MMDRELLNLELSVAVCYSGGVILPPTDMTRITHGPLPEQVKGVELSDFVVAVGYAEKEILPPYETPEHEEAGKRIISYLAQKSFQGVSCMMFDYHEDLSNPPRRLEVVGAYADWCVKDAVSQLLINNHIVHVNQDRIFGSDHNAKQGTLGKLDPQLAIRTALTLTFETVPGAKCHISGGDFIFYSN